MVQYKSQIRPNNRIKRFLYVHENNINILHIIDLNSFLYHFKVEDSDLPYVNPYYNSFIKPFNSIIVFIFSYIIESRIFILVLINIIGW